MLKAVILDMDGVIVDSEPFICEAAIRMFAEHGLTVRPEDFIPFVGAGENRYISGPAEKYGFKVDIPRDKARTYEIYGVVVKGRLEPLEGVFDFIERCRERGLKLALASSADMIKIEINLNEIGLAKETFDAIVSGLDVEKKKPDPEIFLLAAKRLGLAPSECLVVEDSVNGVAAAKAGGFPCLAITSTFTPEQLSDADWFAPNLAEAPEEALDC
ncbi:MAG: HAD-IA family hydrolase [Chloroflexi bacterium]|nr:HAD-IA family hydrolase [Armatimonadota bacterium]MBI2934196.1 HAD-IA family hydrolase [Chloroflexota bacterium]